VEHLSSPPLAVTPLPQPADVGCPDATLHPLRIDDFKGGETGALERLVSYCATRDGLGRYKETRNGLLGNYSSRFSPWLALGCLSPRIIMSEVRKHEARFGANESTYWMQFELLWRDYFRLVFEKYQNRLFQHGGLKQRPTGKADAQRFADWCNGKTRCNFVNANMNELRETGWMSNRGRQNVASYLVHDLGVDWRWGAAWFEYLLLDYDVCSNYGNWNYVAGIGNDPRPNRKFNTSLQQSMYDPDGTFTRTWNVVSQPSNNH
jgi:deoxyribodipyrimidine photo-lyase